MHRRLLTLMLSVITLLATGVPALAQSPTPESTPMAGLQEGASRTYTLDPEGIPSENPQDFVIVTVHLFRFDTTDQASAAWQSVRDSAIASIDPAAASGDAATNIQEEDVSDLGDQAYTAWLSASPEEGVNGYYRLLYVQDGAWLYVLSAMSGSEEHTLTLPDIAQILTERESGPGPVSLNPDGQSTGGIWDKFPPVGDDSLNDLIPFSDKPIAV